MTTTFDNQPRHPSRTPTRAQVREQHVALTRQWTTLLLRDLRDWADTTHVAGHDRLVVLHGTVSGDAGDAESWREELLSVELATRENQYTLHGTDLTPDDDALAGRWETIVELWIDLRRNLSIAQGTPVGTGLVLDLDTGLVATWPSHYCPDFGPLPESLMELGYAEQDLDPFEALLHDFDADFDAGEDRIFTLIEDYALTLPTLPAHDADDPCT